MTKFKKTKRIFKKKYLNFSIIFLNYILERIFFKFINV